MFPFRRDIDLRQFLADVAERAANVLPVPAKIFLVDELEPHSYGYPLTKAKSLDDLEAAAGRWIAEEIALRGGQSERSADLLRGYREQVMKLSRNAVESSILADYHAVFWLVHSQQLARLFSALPKKAMQDLPGTDINEGTRLKYVIFGKWATAIRELMQEMRVTSRFVEMLLDNPLIASEDHIGVDLRELRGYFTGYLRRDYNSFKQAFEDLRMQTASLLTTDKVMRRAVAMLGYPDSSVPHFFALLDPRVHHLVAEHPTFRQHPDLPFFTALAARILDALVVHNLRRGIIWMKTTADGDNVADEGTSTTIYSRAIRPMNFGRRGVVEPVVFRYGLVYDITSFTQTLGEIARGGKGEEQSGYRQMLEFQRELSDVARRYGLQFEKFLGDGAFYTSRRATRIVQAAVEIQDYYARARRNGFAFNKGMRIALNYGYYRLLPMQVSSDGTQIMEFYGPGIVELSRLTTGKATKEIEDIQHLLLSHGYDQSDVYRFFAPLSRIVDRADSLEQQREFYAYVNESGHLINEGIVVSIPFVKQISLELVEDGQKIYRLRTPWAVYLGFGTSNGYVGMRLIGSVSLKGIGMQEVGEIVRVTSDDAEVSVIDENKPLLQLLQQERNRSAARSVNVAVDGESDVGTADLVVCESLASGGNSSVILVGEWDPVSEEVRRPIRLDVTDAERYGLAVPLSAQTVEQQSLAYQKLYRNLSRIETLPSFSVDAIRHNENFSGFIIGATVEPL